VTADLRSRLEQIDVVGGAEEVSRSDAARAGAVNAAGIGRKSR